MNARFPRYANLLMVGLLTIVIGCGGAQKKKLGESCSDDRDCESGLCFDNKCLDPDIDSDQDGLKNGVEKKLGTNPLSADTDGDGKPDGLEVGTDPDKPADADRDGLNDAVESDKADKDPDGDCLPDELDPKNTEFTTDPALLIAFGCLKEGVCGTGASAIVVKCENGEILCNYTAVPDYEAKETLCDNKDNDCDGKTDAALVSKTAGECLAQGVCGAAGVSISRFCRQGKWECDYKTDVLDWEETETLFDGKDNDCDGETDEGLADQPCKVENEHGACDGKTAFEDGKVVCKGQTPEAETCNGQDDDCDGVTDEDLTVAPESACPKKGVCGEVGAQVKDACSGGKWTCNYSGVPGYEPEEASCDGKDNDCDGAVDEELVDQACKVENEFGACNGKTACDLETGKVICVGPVPAAEACNLLDDDCNGWTDDGAEVKACELTNAFGTCKGQTQCKEGKEVCVGPEPSEEVCDAVDNDCDGETDEGMSGLPCENKNEFGTCTGTSKCFAGKLACEGSVPAAETCNDMDDDCDGETDEGLLSKTEGDCLSAGVCGVPDVVIPRHCDAGTWICDYSGVPGWEPEETLCDNKDNDCDGQKDEGLVNQPCSLENEFGSCPGVTRCGDGGETYCYGPQPAAETCNLKDDDCNGETDDWTVPPSCEIANEFGTCIGTATCVEGVEGCDGQTPEADVCDDADNDCDGQTDEDDICFRTAKVSGIVFDGQTKKPIGQANVVVKPGDACGVFVTGIGADGGSGWSQRTTPEGTFHIPVEPGSHCIEVSAAGYQDVTSWVFDVADGEEYPLQVAMVPDVAEQALVTVCGRVTETRNEAPPTPVEGVSLTLYGGSRSNGLASTKSDANGFYCIAGVPGTNPDGEPFPSIGILARKAGYFPTEKGDLPNAPGEVLIVDIDVGSLPDDAMVLLDEGFETDGTTDSAWEWEPVMDGVGWHRLENGLHKNGAVGTCVVLPAQNEMCEPDASDPLNHCAVCAAPTDPACLPEPGALPNAYEGTHAAWFGNLQSFNFLSDEGECKDMIGGTGKIVGGSLTSPWIDTTMVYSLYLSFQSAWEIESVDPQAPPDGFDRMFIEIQVPESEWLEVGFLNPEVDANGVESEPYTSGGFKMAPVWVNYVFDLSEYRAMSQIRIRFRFDSGDENYNAFRGWMVDNVQVLGVYAAE